MISVAFVRNGKKIVTANQGVCKDNELIWYDKAYILSLKFDEEKVQIVIKRIPNAGGEMR
ncbi:hypothetical protein [Pectinatus haikarae]|uniref:hypothetical protein n=1 Tax=Pectinatus haikarae TaxID=349096 RepID=UPI0018C4C721|nr:hypothetical protein [Pectinatus haikarae]